MPFPIFQMPFAGNGMTIGLDATIHVFFSHGIAIGAFAIIAFAEYMGYRYTSPAWERYAHDMVRVVLVLITAIGAILGVGIWFTISSLEPRGTSSMLRVFFAPWFTEWIAFTAELMILLVYYFTWERWTGPLKKRHIVLGFSYAVVGFIAAFLVTGILAFMLTSDGWPWTRDFWSAFFNPSFLPQLLLRLAVGYVLGVIFAIIVLLFVPRFWEFRRQALKPFGWITLVSVVIGLGSAAWYYAVVPSKFTAFAVFAVVTSYVSQFPEVFWIGNILGALLLFALAASAIFGWARVAKLLAIPALVIAMGMVLEFERTREFIRGPYIMPGYMYANQVMMSEEPLFRERGLLANSYWFNATNSPPTVESQGAYLFGQSCSVCHTIGGINNIKERVKGRTQDSLYVIIGHTNEMVPFMVPFSGTDQERRVLAKYLFDLSNGAIAHDGLERFMDIR